MEPEHHASRPFELEKGASTGHPAEHSLEHYLRPFPVAGSYLNFGLSVEQGISYSQTGPGAYQSKDPPGQETSDVSQSEEKATDSTRTTVINSSSTMSAEESNSCHSSSVLQRRKPEVEMILRSHDLENIHLVIRFHLFEDEAWVESILWKRREPVLSTILTNLGFSREATDGLSRDGKLREILKKTEFVSSHPPLKWTPFGARRETDPYRIATDIAQEIRMSFQQIVFEDWVRIAFGHSVESLREFADKLDALSLRLYVHLGRYPLEVKRYRDVEWVSSSHLSSYLAMILIPRTGLTHARPFCAFRLIPQPQSMSDQKPIFTPKCQRRLHCRTASGVV